MIFDADNTLWDTDSVFRSAQSAILRKLAEAGLVTNPESRLEALRLLDQELTKQLRNFEYDFTVLALAAAYYFSTPSLTLKSAVHKALTREEGKIDPKLAIAITEAYESFKDALFKIPKLYPDAEEVLRSINDLKTHGNAIATILLSEGDPARLERILRAHKIRERAFFDEIIIGPKSKQTFERAKIAGQKHLPRVRPPKSTLVIVTGDSLHRDIKFGNEIGAITVYKPSPFKGDEEPHERNERPNYRISKLSELIAILKSLELSQSSAFRHNSRPTNAKLTQSRRAH
jgi:putative hydrolase of the HAD superfamily